MFRNLVNRLSGRNLVVDLASDDLSSAHRLIDKLPEDTKIKINYQGSGVSVTQSNLSPDYVKGLLENQFSLEDKGHYTHEVRHQVFRGNVSSKNYLFVERRPYVGDVVGAVNIEFMCVNDEVSDR